MIRWLSHWWVSGATDRGQKPPRLWRWTFGQIASHRELADEMRELDGQLRRQAASQQRAIAREAMPVGRYPARRELGRGELDSKQTQRSPRWGIGLARPAWAAGLCALIAAGVWLAWPQAPTQSPQQLREASAKSFARVWDPLSQQAQTAGQAFRDRAAQVALLPEKLPAIDDVVSNLGEAIESPIREEVRRFTRDVTLPWAYLAEQLPRPFRERTDEPAAG